MSISGGRLNISVIKAIVDSVESVIVRIVRSYKACDGRYEGALQFRGLL